MALSTLLLRAGGFAIPWTVFALAQFQLLNISDPLTLMMYGGIAALLSLSCRDALLDLLARHR